MAIGAEEMRSMERGPSCGRPLHFARDRQVGQELVEGAHLAQTAWELVNSISRGASQSAYFVRGSF